MPLILTILLTMQAYHLRHWDALYETAETRRVRTLTYYSKPNKLVGECLGFTAMQPDGYALLGMWTFLEALASTAPQEWRGWLVRNGSPMNAARIAALLPRGEVAFVQRALDHFSTPPMDWLEQKEWPSGQTQGVPGAVSGQTQGVPGASTLRWKREDKEKTEVQKEEDPVTRCAIEIPDDRMVFDFGTQFPGEPASGAPGMTVEWVTEWVARMRGRERWPRDWRQKIVADWRAEFRKWLGTKKPAAAKKTAPRERWQIEKDLESVQTQLQEHPKTNWPGNKPCPAKVTDSYANLMAQRKALQVELEAS